MQSEIIRNKRPLRKTNEERSESSISKSGKKKRKTPKIETIDVYTKNPAGERQVQKFLFEAKAKAEDPSKHDKYFTKKARIDLSAVTKSTVAKK